MYAFLCCCTLHNARKGGRLKIFFWLKTNPRTKLCTLEYVRLISRVIISLKIDEKDCEKFQNPLLGKSKLFMVLLLDTILKIFFDMICWLINAISMIFHCVYLCKIQKIVKMQNLGL